MSSNRQRGEKLMLIGTDEFLNINIDKPIQSMNPIKSIKLTNSQEFRTTMKDRILYMEAKQQIFREYPAFMAGLVPWDESMEITQHVVEAGSIDYGMVFMFHCFNILLDDGELPG